MEEYTAADGTRYVALTMEGIQLCAPDDEPVLMLRWAEGDRVLPIWLDSGEMWKLLGDEAAPNRPAAVDAIRDLVELCGGEVLRAEIFSYHEGVFLTRLMIGGTVGSQLGDESDEVELEMRATDALAVAVRAEAGIFAAADVVESASLAGERIFGSDSAREAAARDDVDEFRKFLDSLDADDFGGDGGRAGDGDGDAPGEGK